MNTIKNIVAISLLALLIAGCNISKDLAKPEPPLPVSFRNAASNDSSGIADIKWQNFFSDPALQDLINRAITRNFDMQLALKNIESARLILGQARWAYLPDMRLNINATSNRPSDNSLNGLSTKTFLGTTHVEDFSANIQLSWEADIWGKIKNQRSAALASYLQSDDARKWVQTNLVAGVADGYYNLLMLDAQVAIAKRNVELSDSTLRIIRLQFSSGQVTALAVQQAEAQQLTAAALIPELEKNIVLQENALTILAGDLPGTIARNIKLSQVALPENYSTGVPAELLRTRPDVRNIELRIVRANAQLGIAKASMYPSLAITAGGGLNSFKATNWFNVPASLFGVVAGGLVQPLLQKKQLRTAYELAKVDRERAVIEFRQSVLNAVGEVSNALVRIEKLKEEQRIVSTRVSTLQQAIANSKMLFSSGMANYLEVITAQNNSLQSELELAAIAREQISANVELYRSLGGGWR